MADAAKEFMVEDARLVFKNFAGKEGKYNREGDRSFSVVLTPEVAEQMIQDGWNVKYLDSREDGEADTPVVMVSVNFKNRPPRVVMISSKKRTTLDEASIEVLDWADIKTVDVLARGYEWNVNGKTGVKAYLKSLFVTINEDYLEQKYAIGDED